MLQHADLAALMPVMAVQLALQMCPHRGRALKRACLARWTVQDSASFGKAGSKSVVGLTRQAQCPGEPQPSQAYHTEEPSPEHGSSPPKRGGHPAVRA